MARISHLALVSSPILDFAAILDDPHQKCIQSIGPSNKRRRCKRIIGQADRRRVNEILNVLMSCDHSDSETKALLKELSELSHCNGVHRAHITQIDETARLWLVEHNTRLLSTPSSPTNVPGPSTLNSSPRVSEATSAHVASPHERSPSSGLNTHSCRCFHLRHPCSFHSQSTDSTSAVAEQRLHTYLPYRSTPPSLAAQDFALLNMIGKDLLSTDKNSGYVYIFSRLDESSVDTVCGKEMFKIGFTNVAVNTRLDKWKQQCNYTPRLIYASQLIPFARRVEQLSLAELSKARRKESWCRTNPTGCGKGHIEWVDSDIDTIREIVERWVGWIEQVPYDNKTGKLVGDWKRHVDGLHVPIIDPEDTRGINTVNLRWKNWINAFDPVRAQSRQQANSSIHRMRSTNDSTRDSERVSAIGSVSPDIEAASTSTHRAHIDPQASHPGQTSLSSVQDVLQALAVFQQTVVLAISQLETQTRNAEEHRRSTFATPRRQATATF